MPWELYSVWIPNSGHYALGIKNLFTAEERVSAFLWGLKNNLTPAWIDIDQEGGRGPLALARTDVYVGR